MITIKIEEDQLPDRDHKVKNEFYNKIPMDKKTAHYVEVKFLYSNLTKYLLKF